MNSNKRWPLQSLRGIFRNQSCGCSFKPKVIWMWMRPQERKLKHYCSSSFLKIKANAKSCVQRAKMKTNKRITIDRYTQHPSTMRKLSLWSCTRVPDPCCDRRSPSTEAAASVAPDMALQSWCSSAHESGPKPCDRKQASRRMANWNAKKNQTLRWTKKYHCGWRINFFWNEIKSLTLSFPKMQLWSWRALHGRKAPCMKSEGVPGRRQPSRDSNRDDQVHVRPKNDVFSHLWLHRSKTPCFWIKDTNQKCKKSRFRHRSSKNIRLQEFPKCASHHSQK